VSEQASTSDAAILSIQIEREQHGNRVTSGHGLGRSQWSVIALLLMLAFVILEKLNGQGQLFYLGQDRFADFLKVVLAFPGAAPAPDHLGLGPLINEYWHSPDYRLPEFGLYHLPPLSMLLTLLARLAFGIVSPTLIFMALVALFAASMAGTLQRFTNDVGWAVTPFVSYPLLTIIDRGNLYAALCATCLVAALLRRRPDWFAAFLFAIALNVRPNAAFLALPLFILDWRFAYRAGLVGGIIALLSAITAHALFPSYTISSFLHGLQIYANEYAISGEGVPFGSSLFGAGYLLRMPYLFLATIIGVAPLLPACVLFYRRKMSYDEFVYVCSAVTGMATSVFADYHLLVFLAPLILARNLSVSIPSLLLLAPKGWWVIAPDASSIQVILNPLIMLCGSWWLIFSAAARALRGARLTRGRQETEPPPRRQLADCSEISGRQQPG